MKYLSSIMRRALTALRYIMLMVFHPKSFKTRSVLGSVAMGTSFSINGGMLKIGKNLQTRGNTHFIVENGALNIGNNCFFNYNNIITSLDNITIGDNCSFGPNVMIFDHDHDYRSNSGDRRSKKYKTSPIKIGNNVWIGGGVIILKGVTIGDNAVVGAGTIVTKDVPKNTVIWTKNNHNQTVYMQGE